MTKEMNQHTILMCYQCTCLLRNSDQRETWCVHIMCAFHGLGEKGSLKEVSSSCQDINFSDLAIALTSMVTRAGHNCDEIPIVLCLQGG